MDIFAANRAAWNEAARRGNPYAQPVSAEQVAAARNGHWEFHLSEMRTVPASWFPALAGARVLCLASGGGQQAPILAAAGAQVWVLDASPGQLAQDRMVADRDGLELVTVEADMSDLSMFADEQFDVIVNPPSTLFVPNLEPIWRECHRSLQPDGILMTSFLNPDEFIFDPDALDRDGTFVVRYPLPYVEHETLTPAEQAERQKSGLMFHFSHTMESQLGGILHAGFVITDFYEDRRPESDGNPIRHFMPSVYVVRATRAC